MSRRLLPLAVTAALLLVLGLVQPASAALPSKATWSADVTKALTNAKPQLDDRVAQGGSMLALNLDIDNTAIATQYAYPNAVPQVASLAKRYQAKGVAILFNTGRYNTELAGIKKVLAKAGYAATYVCGRPKGYSIVAGKQYCRRLFLKRGYTLIANIGNNTSDFKGEPYAERGYRLPDYNGQLS